MKNVKMILPLMLALSMLLTGCQKAAELLPGIGTGTASSGLRAGGYLYRELDDELINNIGTNLPSSAELRKDEEGDTAILQTAKKAEVDTLVRLFTNIRIGEETDLFVTDSYNSVTFKWADGKSASVSFNGSNLEVKENGSWHYYTLKNFDEFWETAWSGSIAAAGAETETDEGTEETEPSEEKTESTEKPTEETTTEETTEESTTEEETTGESTEEETTEESTTGEEVSFDIVPSKASFIECEYYENAAFSALVPKGWKVDIFPGDYLHYTFKIYDPSDPRLMVFFNMKTEGYTMNAKDWQFFQNTYPDSIFAKLPYIDPQTTENFYNHFTEALTPNDSDAFTFPVIRDFTKIETYGTNATKGEIVRAHYTNGNGDGVDGVFSASLYPVNLYYMYLLNVYDTWYVSAPENELPDWLEVLETVFSSIEFTDTFIGSCYDQIDIEAHQNAEIAKICSQMTDIVMQGWYSQQESYDRISQKQSDATMGYERVYDTETGEIYKAPVDFYDNYSGDRYVPVTDDQYLLPVDGYIEY